MLCAHSDVDKWTIDVHSKAWSTCSLDTGIWVREPRERSTIKQLINTRKYGKILLTPLTSESYSDSQCGLNEVTSKGTGVHWGTKNSNSLPQSHIRAPHLQSLFPGIRSLQGSAMLSPVGTTPLAPTPAQLFSHHPEEYSSLPLIPTTSLLLRQDRTTETSRWPLWHAMSAFWLQHVLCTQQQTETWQSLHPLHWPTEPSLASSTPRPSAFMGSLHTHRMENRDPAWGLQRIIT